MGHAILAPNPHNMQPWLADLGVAGEITLFVDRTRLLPETDPLGRQIVIGCGCFLELLVMALREKGFAPDVQSYPDGGGGPGGDLAKPFARVRLSGAGTDDKDPLFAQIPKRRSNKEPYDPARPLTPAHGRRLASAIDSDGLSFQLARPGDQFQGVRDIARRAMMLEMETPRTHRESIERLRIGAEAIAKHRDGIDLNGPMFWWMNRLGLITSEALSTPGTMAWQGGIDYALGWLDGTASYGWMTSAANDRATQLAAGRAYARLNLQATALGVAMHPNSQVLQEYAEMAALQREFLSLTETPGGHTVQMLFRLGYGDAPPPSPRRPLKQIIAS